MRSCASSGRPSFDVQRCKIDAGINFAGELDGFFEGIFRGAGIIHQQVAAADFGERLAIPRINRNGFLQVRQGFGTQRNLLLAHRRIEFLFCVRRDLEFTKRIERRRERRVIVNRLQ